MTCWILQRKHCSFTLNGVTSSGSASTSQSNRIKANIQITFMQIHVLPDIKRQTEPGDRGSSWTWYLFIWFWSLFTVCFPLALHGQLAWHSSKTTTYVSRNCGCRLLWLWQSRHHQASGTTTAKQRVHASATVANVITSFLQHLPPLHQMVLPWRLLSSSENCFE